MSDKTSNPEDKSVTTPGNIQYELREKSLVSAYLLLIPPLGLLGAHHFYLRRPAWGCLYFFTLGAFGIGFLVDIFRLPGLVKRLNKERAEGDEDAPNKKYTAEAYLLWLPLGFFGAHHFYLRHYGWGFAYFFTFGFFGMGWLMDAFLLPMMVSEYNELDKNEELPKSTHKRLSTAYRLWTFPGFLGAHHYYMGRTAFGLYYTFTFGGAGVGWFCDMFRMKWLIKDTNKAKDGCSFCRERRLDDCYLMLFPFGFLGIHHFYLHRIGWGFLYFFTCGCFGIGWIVDFFRLPSLVRQHNELVRDNASHNHNQAEIGGVDNLGATEYPESGSGAGGGGSNVYTVPPMYDAHHYPVKADGTEGLPPQYVAPPGYDEAGMSSFSTIDSSNVDGLPSYQDAVLGTDSYTQTNA